jgi:hypothetical protein
MKKPVKKSPAKAKSWVEWRLQIKPNGIYLAPTSFPSRPEAVKFAYEQNLYAKYWHIIKTRVTVIE